MGAPSRLVGLVPPDCRFIENYLIGPRIYGGRLQLSNVAVLVAFAIGAELGGVVAALLAMPIAATYPTIEKVVATGKAS